MSNRVAIIVGYQGQDGSLLSNLLRQRDYTVLGIGRESMESWGAIPTQEPCCLDDAQSIFDLVISLQPLEIYYLAAHHASSQARKADDIHSDYQLNMAVNTVGLLHFLEAIRLYSPKTRLFFASSSLIFGSQPLQAQQDELTQVAPGEPYGLCKALAGQICKDYRRQHSIFASVGILYNHESSLRSPQYLSMKIVEAALAASRGASQPLMVGSLDAVVDWGYAPDYVDAFTRILALDAPDDFVVATGAAHTVRDFAAVAFGCLGLDWQQYVVQDPSILTRSRSGRVGDSSKLRRLTGWQPSLPFEEMVVLLVDQVSARLQGKRP